MGKTKELSASIHPPLELSISLSTLPACNRCSLPDGDDSARLQTLGEAGSPAQSIPGTSSKPATTARLAGKHGKAPNNPHLWPRTAPTSGPEQPPPLAQNSPHPWPRTAPTPTPSGPEQPPPLAQNSPWPRTAPGPQQPLALSCLALLCPPPPLPGITYSC